MPNSDNTYGTYNKQTKIISQVCPESGYDTPITFADVAAAKSYFYNDAALAVMDECCTQLEYALVDTNTKLKYTMSFGTKGGNIAAEDDWTGQFNSRRSALIASGNWMKQGVSADSSDHLF